MLRSRFLPAAVAAALLAATAVADDPKPPLTPTEKLEQQQKEILQKLRDLQTDVSALKARLDTADSHRVEWLDSMVTRNKLDDLHKELLQMRAELNSATRERTSGSAPMPAGGDSTRIKPTPVPERIETMRPPLFGTVRLVNNFPTLQQVQVNGELHPLLPGQELDVLVPAGPFSFRVLGVDFRPRTRTVPPGQVYTFQID